MRKFAAGLAAVTMALSMGTSAMAQSYDHSAFKWTNCTNTDGEISVTTGSYTNVNSSKKDIYFTNELSDNPDILKVSLDFKTTVPSGKTCLFKLVPDNMLDSEGNTRNLVAIRRTKDSKGNDTGYYAYIGNDQTTKQTIITNPTDDYYHFDIEINFNTDTVTVSSDAEGSTAVTGSIPKDDTYTKGYIQLNRGSNQGACTLKKLSLTTIKPTTAEVFKSENAKPSEKGYIATLNGTGNAVKWYAKTSDTDWKALELTTPNTEVSGEAEFIYGLIINDIPTDDDMSAYTFGAELVKVTE